MAALCRYGCVSDPAPLSMHDNLSIACPMSIKWTEMFGEGFFCFIIMMSIEQSRVVTKISEAFFESQLLLYIFSIQIIEYSFWRFTIC